MAVTNCAMAKGFSSIMLLGTPLDAQSGALSPLMYMTGTVGSISRPTLATSQPSGASRNRMSVIISLVWRSPRRSKCLLLCCRLLPPQP